MKAKCPVRQTSDKSDAALLVDAKAAAEFCGKSLRTWRSWDSAGLIPNPVRIGRSTLWRIEELRAWVEAGCPRRKDWKFCGRKSSERT
jgi:predicted DNA-binding transcriptional regulator AlpA